MLNTCSFIGRLVVEPELKTTVGGTAFTKARIAVQRDIPKNKGALNESGFKDFESDFIPFAVWGPTAQYLAKVQKGKMISVTGRMQTSQYTDAQNNKQTGFELNVESWYALEKSHNENNGSNNNSARNQQQPQQQQPQQSFGQNQASFGQNQQSQSFQQPQQGFLQPSSGGFGQGQQPSFQQPQQVFQQPSSGGFGQNQQNNGFGNGFNSPTNFQ
jgi:single-strand DNA-binding protein